MHPYLVLLWVSWVVLGLGIVIALVGFRGRAMSRSLCRSCRYDMAGINSATCPECGKDPRLGARPPRKVRWRIVLIGALVASSFAARKVWIDPIGKRWWAMMPKSVRTAHGTKFGVAYQIMTEREDTYTPATRIDGMSTVQIMTKGGWMTVAEGRYVDVDPLPLPQKPQEHVVMDMTGDGTPDLLVWCFSGGAHCCFSLIIVDSTAPDRFMTVDGRNSPVVVEDIDKDGVGEMRVADWTFEYWKVPYYMSPWVEVIANAKGGAIGVRTDLMKKPPMPDAELAASALEVKQKIVKDTVDPNLWATMLKLLYSGNDMQAWTFLNQATPWTPAELEKFKEEFTTQLKTSPWWPMVDRGFAAN